MALKLVNSSVDFDQRYSIYPTPTYPNDSVPVAKNSKYSNKFHVLQFTPQIIHKQFEVNKRKCENLIISLFDKGVIEKICFIIAQDIESKKTVIKR